MAHYAPCTNCAVDKNACQRRASIAEAIRGQHVYSLKFRCDVRQPMFQPGQRVVFNWTFWDEGDGYGEPSGLPMVFRGTVLRERGTKFTVQVDSGEDASGEGIEARHVFKNEHLLIKVHPIDMRPIDEPARQICQVCLWVEGVDESRCHRTPKSEWMHEYTPVGCAAHSQEAA